MSDYAEYREEKDAENAREYREAQIEEEAGMTNEGIPWEDDYPGNDPQGDLYG